MQNESTGSFANKHNNSSHYFIFVILPSLTPLKSRINTGSIVFINAVRIH